MTEHKNQAHFCEETIQHSIVIMCLLCLLRRHSDLHTSPALPSSQWSAGPWAKPMSASLLARAGPDHLHPPWVGPPKLTITLRQGHRWGRREVIPGWKASPGGRHSSVCSSNTQATLHITQCLCNCSLHQVLFWQLKMRDTIPREGIQAVPTDSETTSFTLCICQS